MRVLAVTEAPQPLAAATYVPLSGAVVVGAYELRDGDTQSRSGSVSVYRVRRRRATGEADAGARAGADAAECELERVCMLRAPDAPGAFHSVLDRDGTGVLVACTDSSVRRVAAADASRDAGAYEQVVVARVPGGGDGDASCASVSVTSVAFWPAGDGNGGGGDRATRLAVGLADGRAALLDAGERGCADAVWQAHSFETWMVECADDEHSLWSGGDDALLKRWDVRTAATAPAAVCRVHGAGVTAVRAVPGAIDGTGWCLLSGSYDDRIRAWDVRALRAPLGELELGGGVWRIKPARMLRAPAHGVQRLLVACMYNGAMVVDWHTGTGTFGVHDHCADQHKSMAYDIDEVRVDGNGEPAVLSVSFYDKRAVVWR